MRWVSTCKAQQGVGMPGAQPLMVVVVVVMVVVETSNNRKQLQQPGAVPVSVSHLPPPLQPKENKLF